MSDLRMLMLAVGLGLAPVAGSQEPVDPPAAVTQESSQSNSGLPTSAPRVIGRVSMPRRRCAEWVRRRWPT